MKTSRQRLLEYIDSQRVVTVEDLSRALQMTEANARYHLGILQQQGLVAVVGQRSRRGRGRPAPLYGLSEQALGHNLDKLASVLLNESLSGLPLEERDVLIHRLAQSLAGVASAYDNSMETPEPISDPAKRAVAPLASPSQRLMQAVRHLNTLHYHARWEAHALAPRVILGHCPYASLVKDHPEICRLDAALLETLLGAQVTQLAKLAPDRRGARFCMFSIELA